jgi:hypothetical protein
LSATGSKPRSAQMHSACAARPADMRGTARVHGAGAAQLGQPVRRTALLGEPTWARRRRMGDGEERRLTGAGTAKRRRRASGEAAGAAVWATAWSVRRPGRRRRAVPTAALSHGRRLTGGARSSAFSELKITPNDNSSKQIARN